MKTLLAAAMLFGSTVGALAVESYGDYRDYFDAKPVTMKRAPCSVSDKTYPVDMRRHADGDRSERYVWDNDLKPMSNQRSRSWDGGHVPASAPGAAPGGFWGRTSVDGTAFKGR